MNYFDCHLLVLFKLWTTGFCCLYKSDQVQTSVDNATFVEFARSAVECTFQCQRLKKTPFYTEDKKCYCLDKVQDSVYTEDVKNGLIYKKAEFSYEERQVQHPSPTTSPTTTTTTTTTTTSTTTTTTTTATTTVTPTTQPQLQTYTMSIRISIYCYDDAGSTCEIYGSLKLNIGNRASNQNIAIWGPVSGSSTVEINERTPKYYSVTKSFQEYEAFQTSNDKISISGTIKESDITGDDTIATFSNVYIYARDVFGVHHSRKKKYGSDWVEVRIIYEK
ncbi:uncharacterized protein [Clytia hemisphaerica]|uniref:Cnidarian restricted protein n=1 Tax=Clytia hemisphaerica TaxID=252671 RepID=A0A7M6DK74_9CNID